jgi:hypothetical protein
MDFAAKILMMERKDQNSVCRLSGVEYPLVAST